MQRTRTRTNSRSLTVLALAAAVGLAGGWLGPAARPVAAVAPGANGLIAFDSNRTTPDNPEGDAEIFVMNPDGTGVKQLTFNAAGDFEPAWSLDGKKIAFTSNRDGNQEVYTMMADGTGQRNRTHNPADDSEPAWSPDGTQIAFMSRRNGNYEVYTMRANGSNQTRRTKSPAFAERFRAPVPSAFMT